MLMYGVSFFFFLRFEWIDTSLFQFAGSSRERLNQISLRDILVVHHVGFPYLVNTGLQRSVVHPTTRYVTFIQTNIL